jgi:hypothetical protein
MTLGQLATLARRESAPIGSYLGRRRLIPSGLTAAP